MSFLQTQTNNNNRNLTEKQQKFLDALSGEAQGDIKAALTVALSLIHISEPTRPY